MILPNVLKKLRKVAENTDVSNVDFLAVQVNLTDNDPGVFYVEVKDHQINIEPYNYYDRNCAITITSTNFNKLVDGKIDAVEAFLSGKLTVEGDVDKALEFANLLKK